ncbi:hypothetical protein F4802DRAFT_189840 [Xylaria palmicola]|nr:hypothetical protein F4802DRAFT_189840 [Xylaria palmicola]
MGNSTNEQESVREELPDLPTVGHQRRWDIAKVVLRAFSLVIGIVDVVELTAIQTSRKDLHYRATISYFVLAGIIVWDVVEFIVIFIRRSPAKGIHPGAHVGVELILWLGGVITVAAVAYNADWGQLNRGYEQPDGALYSWTNVALSHFTFLGFLVALRFGLFVRACIEVDRRKKDRRVQELVLAIQRQGRDPRDVPLSTFRAVAEMDHVTPSTVRKALSAASGLSTLAAATPTTATGSATLATPQRSRSSVEERDFAHKYNFPIVTVQELLEAGIHPEEARNQKVLIDAFPRYEEYRAGRTAGTQSPARGPHETYPRT